MTFMSVSAAPAFVEDYKIFIRERLNGWYTVSSFVVAHTLGSLPFVFAIAIASSACVYYLVDLR